MDARSHYLELQRRRTQETSLYNPTIEERLHGRGIGLSKSKVAPEPSFSSRRTGFSPGASPKLQFVRDAKRIAKENEYPSSPREAVPMFVKYLENYLGRRMNPTEKTIALRVYKEKDTNIGEGKC